MTTAGGSEGRGTEAGPSAMGGAALRETSVFAGLGAESAARIAASAVRRHVGAGEALFEAGDEARTLYLVESGSLELSFAFEILAGRQEVVLERAGPRSVVAWSALVPPHRLTLGARAAGATVVWCLERDDVLQVLAQDPSAGYLVMARIAATVSQRFQALQALLRQEIQRQVSEKYK